MHLIAVGMSHHTAPLEVRERLAFTRTDYADRVSDLCALSGVNEAVVLSTCNRTEIYTVAPADQLDAVRTWLSGQGGLDAEDSEQLFYTLTGEIAVHHLFRVACGLDSVVLGEPQIIGQLKEAWQAARDAGGAGRITDRLFQRAFAISKLVRTVTGINQHPVSVAYITAVLAQQIFGDLTSKTVLMIGAGEMIELCGRHFHQQGVERLLICNRSLDRAQTLAENYQGEAFGLDSLKTRLAEADILISSTSAREPVLTAEALASAIRLRRHRPMFIVDLGVPRDVDPAAADLRDIYLYTIDDLQQVADDNHDQRRKAAKAAETTIDAAVNDFMRWSHGVRAAASLRRLREHADRSGNEMAERALRQIQGGADPRKVVQRMANSLVNKILHLPSERLREAAEAEHYDMLEAADWLFDTGKEDE